MSNRNISVLTWFNFFTDFKLYAPIAIIYFSQITGSYALGMSIFSIVFISSAVAELPTGILSDFVGRRKTMIFGALSAVCYSIFYAIGISYGVLVVGAILEGISRAFYSGTSDALLHDTLAEQEKEAQYGEYLGKVSSMFQISLATSAVLGGFLAEWSFSLIMWISVLSQLICLVLAFRFTDPAVKSEKNNNIFAHIREASKKFASNYKLRLLSIASMYAFALGEAM
jgi:MFS family permease